MPPIKEVEKQNEKYICKKFYDEENKHRSKSVVWPVRLLWFTKKLFSDATPQENLKKKWIGIFRLL